jgi:hypothetical protein
MRRLVVKFLLAATAAASVVGGMPAHSQTTEAHGLAISTRKETGMLTLTARGTDTDRASLDLVLKLNHAATVAIYAASANAGSLATICGKVISIPGICDDHAARTADSGPGTARAGRLSCLLARRGNTAVLRGLPHLLSGVWSCENTT